MGKSFGLVRTNTGITTNTKIMVASDYSLFLESIESTPELSNSRFKKFIITKDTLYDQVLPVFYTDLSGDSVATDIAFAVRDDNDSTVMYTDFNKQFDNIYWAGCQEVSNTNYNEEFEAFAPLYLDKYSMPTNFIIFRVDGSGVETLEQSNVRSEILNKFKVVTLFDMVNSNLGLFIKNNIINNASFPARALEIDVREDKFSEWSGIDYDIGGYTSKSLFMNDFYETSNPFYYFDKTLTDGYKNNHVVYPNIWNLNFLFNDTPATPTSLREWSINRYYGFYLDSLNAISKLTFCTPEILVSNIQIIADNIIVDLSGNSIDPTVRGWDDTRYYYVEYLGNFYTLTRYYGSDGSFTYKIISALSLIGMQALLNKQILQIDTNNYISYNPSYNTASFSIPNFNQGDCWIININNVYHTIKQDSNGYYLYTDYGFNLSGTTLQYYINSPDPNYLTTLNLSNLTIDNPPLSVVIYQLNFSTIKDFDTQIIETDFSRFEYEQVDDLTQTDETKLYREDFTSNSFPKPVEEFTYKNVKTNVPASSEYVATSEIFSTENEDTKLVELWKKNTNWLKWGYQDSVSAYDYTYRFNNSLLGEDFNRTTNLIHTTPNAVERNLDYFYTLNASTSSYVFQSLHINSYDSNFNIDPTFNFEIDKYFNVGTYSGDYFTYLFGKKDYFNHGATSLNTKKYSYLTVGDNDYPNATVFRGIKFNFYDNKGIVKNGAAIKSISLQPTNDLVDYKFSILLSSFDKNIDNHFTSSVTGFQWEVIPTYTNGDSYATNSTVVWHDILFDSLVYTNSNDPNINPTNSSYWTYSALTSSIFWSPQVSYNQYDIIYNSGDYWSRTGISASNASDMWNPLIIYASGSNVLRNASLYTSNTITDSEPGLDSTWLLATMSSAVNNWNLVNLWDQTRYYNTKMVLFIFPHLQIYKIHQTHHNYNGLKYIL